MNLKAIFYKLPSSVQRKFGHRLRNIQNLSGGRRQRQDSSAFDALEGADRKYWIFQRMKTIAVYAQGNNQFYREYYEQRQFDARLLNTYEDLSTIPIVNKEILRNAGEKWNPSSIRAYKGNTGGTSGSPLGFSFDREQLFKESLFMGKVWSRLNCSTKNTRLVFGGLSHLGERSWLYFPEGDCYLINAYKPLQKMKNDLLQLFAREKIEFLHGYPSAIYQFAKFCLQPVNADLRDAVQKKVKGVLYGSEFPALVYRNTVREAFNVPSISWYGHREKVVLAAEKEQHFDYYPFQAYGWCEAVDMHDGRCHLIGTNYGNSLSPFIRYDTGDGIKSISAEHGVLEVFRITEGRLGEFILDVNNCPISLTSLIFGRYHRIFDTADYVQISQTSPGKATLHVVGKVHENLATADLFDLKNVDIDFEFRFRDTPYRTRLGKIPLSIPSDLID